MIDSIDMAKYILKKASSLHLSLNLTQIQKITYICDGALLAKGTNLIEENCQAWDYGPVYPRIYKWYKKNIGNLSLEIAPTNSNQLQETEVDSIVTQAVEKFGKWTAGQLSEWSHRPNSPWDNAVKNNFNRLYGKISKNDMKMYFSGLLNG